MQATDEARLESLLASDPSRLWRQAHEAFLEASHGRPHLVLFGAGRLGRVTRAALARKGIEPVAFADNNPKLWGTKIDGVSVLSPDDAGERFHADALFVITVYTATPVRRQLSVMGMTAVGFPALAWEHADVLLPHGCLDRPEGILQHGDAIRGAARLWSDADSQREFVDQVEWRLAPYHHSLPSPEPAENTYFPSELVELTDREVFVDCGAFDGDSARAFLHRTRGQCQEVIAIEPDPSNQQRLEDWKERLDPELRSRVRMLPFAVGATRDRLAFDAAGDAGSTLRTQQDILRVDIAPLDELLANVAPTYIKFDVEGAEPDALVGASRVIAEHAPILAVCLYHRQDDLWRLPAFVASLTDRYRFFLRRYCDDCWEQVLYAIPRSRLKQGG